MHIKTIDKIVNVTIWLAIILLFLVIARGTIQERRHGFVIETMETTVTLDGSKGLKTTHHLIFDNGLRFKVTSQQFTNYFPGQKLSDQEMRAVVN